MTRRFFPKKLELGYWLLPIVLTLAQLVYTLASVHQIRLEELSESVRNPFWFAHREIFDGVSSNIGWYFQLLLLYQVFGFSLHLAKWFRVGLQLVSLLSLAAVLKKWLGIKRAWLPLLAIGLSPTWLFFNTLQAQLGIDLQYLPVCLYLLVSLDFSQKRLSLLQTFLLGSLSMVAAMTYPTFLFYLPFFGAIYLYKLLRTSKSIIWPHLGIATGSFLWPLAAGFAYVTNRRLLINDTQELNSGIFRGGGRWAPLDNLWPTIYSGIEKTMADLFVRGQTYYVEVVRPEFSHPATITAVIIIALTSFWLVTKKQWRALVLLTWFVLISNLVVPNFSDWTQGLRRHTPALAAFYILFCLVWKAATEKRRILPYFIRILVMGSGFILLLHHLKVYKDNYLTTLPLKSPHQENLCFGIIPNAPAKSLKVFVERAKNTGQIDLVDLNNNPLDCRLHEIYPAVAGSCLWNKLGCQEIQWFDEARSRWFVLSPDLWVSDRFLP